MCSASPLGVSHPIGRARGGSARGTVVFSAAPAAWPACAARGSRPPRLRRHSRRLPPRSLVRRSSRSAIFSQRCRHDSEMPKFLATWAIDASLSRATAMTSRRNSFANGWGTMLLVPVRPQPHRQGNRTLRSPVALSRPARHRRVRADKGLSPVAGGRAESAAAGRVGLPSAVATYPCGHDVTRTGHDRRVADA